MSLKELALEELSGVSAFLSSLAFIRLVKMETPQFTGTYAILGVPPWRTLRTKDCYDKKVVQVF